MLNGRWLSELPRARLQARVEILEVLGENLL